MKRPWHDTVLLDLLAGYGAFIILAVALLTLSECVLPPAHAQLYPSNPPLLGELKQDAYGPGVNSDATGRAFYWTPSQARQASPDPTIQPRVNQYGFGRSADQYGREIEPAFQEDTTTGRNRSHGIYGHATEDKDY